jgi:glycosyltransferase involved in cell wall biosynthesis
MADVAVRHGLVGELGESGNFTLAVGTIQPRKNIERLIAAHEVARSRETDLGPLVLAGAVGWGEVSTEGAITLGEVDEADLATLVANCRVMAYVPIEEGWGLPPIEALAAGRPVVASAVPSVLGNPEVVVVDPLEVDSIADGLVAALRAGDDETDRERRRASVQDLTWANCARDHLAAWR